MTKFSNLNLEQGSKMIRTIWHIKKLMLLSGLVLMIFGNSQALADQKVAIIDLGLILSKSKALTKADKDLSAMEAAYKKEREAKESKLRDEEQKLRQQRAIISPEAFTKKREDFSKRVRAHQISVRVKGQQFAATRLKIVEKIEKAMEPIVSRIAKKVGADVIVERKKTFFALKILDISNQVLQGLNKSLPSIKVTLVKPPKK